MIFEIDPSAGTMVRAPRSGFGRLPYEHTAHVFWLMYVCASGEAADVLVRAPSIELARMVVDESELVEWSYENPILMGDAGNLRRFLGSAPVRLLTADEAYRMLTVERYVTGKACVVWPISKKRRRRRKRKQR